MAGSRSDSALPPRSTGRPSVFPALDRLAELEEGDDAGRDRHPEGDQAEDQDRREDGRPRGCRRGRRRRSCRRRPRRPRPAPAGRGWRPCRGRSPGRRRPAARGRRRRGRRPRGRRCWSPRSRRRRAPRGRRARGGRRARARSGTPPPPSPAPWRRWRGTARARSPWAKGASRRSRSGGISAIRTPITSSSPATAAGMIVSSTESLPLQHPGPQQDPEDDQRQRVEGVVEGEEGDHPPGDVAARHPRLAQRPVGEGDAAGAAGREEQRRRHPGHVDLVGLPPASAAARRRRPPP